MADRSAIEWTDATWNPARGCTRVSEGCRNCYAESIAARFSGAGLAYEGLATREGGKPRWTGKLSFGHDLEAPLRWRQPRRIFVNSMSDLFHEAMLDAWIDHVFAIMALCPQHTFQCLTKRPSRMRAYITVPEVEDRISAVMDDIAPAHWCTREIEDFGGWPLPNVWLGTSCEDQAAADVRVPELLRTPAALRFISAEPLLGGIDFRTLRGPPIDYPEAASRAHWIDSLTGEHGSFLPMSRTVRQDRYAHLDWIIVGGESGPGARPMHPAWARDIRDQCAAAGVAFFFKQNGEWLDSIGQSAAHAFTHVQGLMVSHVGKKRAGRLLDGRTHDAMPEVRR